MSFKQDCTLTEAAWSGLSFPQELRTSESSCDHAAVNSHVRSHTQMCVQQLGVQHLCRPKPRLHFRDDQGIVIPGQGHALQCEHVHTHTRGHRCARGWISHTAGVPGLGLHFPHLRGGDEALLTLSLAPSQERLVPTNTALNGSAQVPGIFFRNGDGSLGGAAVKPEFGTLLHSGSTEGRGAGGKMESVLRSAASPCAP